MRRHRKALSPAASLILVCAACGASGPMQLETAKSEPEAERSPPGVAVDPVSELPRRQSLASTRSGLLVLATPHSVDSARELVKDFFRAVVTGSHQRLMESLSPKCWHDTGSGRTRARGFWNTRLTRLSYGELSGYQLFLDREIESFETSSIEALPPGRKPKLTPGKGQVVIRVPMRVHTIGRTRYFGDELVFRLEPENKGFTIVEIVESFVMH